MNGKKIDDGFCPSAIRLTPFWHLFAIRLLPLCDPIRTGLLVIPFFLLFFNRGLKRGERENTEERKNEFCWSTILRGKQSDHKILSSSSLHNRKSNTFNGYFWATIIIFHDSLCHKLRLYPTAATLKEWCSHIFGHI